MKTPMPKTALMGAYLVIGIVRAYYWILSSGGINEESYTNGGQTVVGFVYILAVLFWPLIVLIDDILGGIGSLVLP